MEYLEDFQNNDFGSFAFALNTKPSLLIYTNYNNYSIQSFRFTNDSLLELEHSTDYLNNGTQILPAISLWYLSLDSFLNTLLKIICIKNKSKYTDKILLTLENRFLLILENFGIGIEATTNKLVKKLLDFERFNKLITHDLFEDEQLSYTNTNFSVRPNLVNQTDLLQAFLITYEVFEAFRFIITGLDLMPNISLLTKEKVIVFEKLSVLKQKILIPSVKDILTKHKLKLRLNLDEQFTNYPKSTLFEKKEIIPLIRIKQDKAYKVDLSYSKTQIGVATFDWTLS